MGVFCPPWTRILYYYDYYYLKIGYNAVFVVHVADDRSGVDKTKKPPDGLVRHDGYITEAGTYY